MKLVINRCSVITYIMLSLCVLGANTVYSTCSTHDFKIPELTVIFLCILLISARHLSKNITKKWSAWVIPYCLLNFTIIFFSVSSDSLISYTVRFLVFVPFLTLLILHDAKKNNIWNIAFKFERLVVTYAAITLVLWLLASVFNILPPTGGITSSWGHNMHYPLYFGLYTTKQTQFFLGTIWIRNQGFFTEAPMYNVILIVALCIEVFVASLTGREGKFIWNGMDLRKLIILVLTDLSTVTTTGMIVMVLIAAFKYCLMRNKSAIIKILKWLGAIVVLLIAAHVAYWLFLNKSITGSWEVRFDDFKAGNLAWHNNILFGNGYDTMKSINRYMSSYRLYNMGYSSGIFSVLAQGGIALFCNYVFGFWGYIKFSINLHRFELIAMLIVILVILLTSIFQYTFVMMLLLAYGYALLINSMDVRHKGA